VCSVEFELVDLDSRSVLDRQKSVDSIVRGPEVFVLEFLVD